MKYLVAVVFLFLVSTAHGAHFSSWFDQSMATGNWNGYRGGLEDDGITISSNFTTDILGNPLGGLNKGITYAGFFDLSVAFDLEKLAGFQGLALRVTNYLASGQNLSATIGNFFAVQEIYTSGNYFFGELDLSLSLYNNQLIFEVGRLFAGDVFARNELWQYYLSDGINGNLNSIESNIFFPQFNIAVWGARVTVQPNKQWHFVSAIYNADSSVEASNKHGVDFSLATDQGYLAIGQMTYKHHQAREDNGLPGSMTFGGYYESSTFQYVADPTRSKRGNYGLYLIVDQMLYRKDWLEFSGPSQYSSTAVYSERVRKPNHRQIVVPLDRPQGLTAWMGAYLAPQERINTQVYQLATGLLYQGLFECRERDVTAFCVVHGRFSDQLIGQETETVVELNHRFQCGPWLYFTPDIQYIIQPNGQRNIPNALALGAEISANF